MYLYNIIDYKNDEAFCPLTRVCVSSLTKSLCRADFKKQNGFHGPPSAAGANHMTTGPNHMTTGPDHTTTGADHEISPHGIPVVGQENSYRYGGSSSAGYRQETRSGDSTEGFDGGAWVDDDSDDFASRRQQQRDYHDHLLEEQQQQQQPAEDAAPDEDLFKFDDDFGIDFAGPSPFKYHRQVSADRPSPFDFHRDGSASVLSPFKFHRGGVSANDDDDDGDGGSSKSGSDGIDDEVRHDV